MRHQLSTAIHIATIVAWMVAAVDASPWGFDLPPDRFLFTIATACVSSYAWIAQANARPVDEVYAAGIARGRHEVECERSEPRVTRMTERRLTVVGD